MNAETGGIKMEEITKYILEQLQNLLSIDSPTGYTKNVTDYLMAEYENLGYTPKRTVKGGVLTDLGGEDPDNAVFLEAHVDTLGAMVSQIKSNGRLAVSPLGGMNANNAEAENCRIITRFNGTYEGTCQLTDASVHVNGKYNETSRSFDVMEILLDEKVSTRDEVLASRFLDDKLSAAILLGYARYLKENQITPERKIYQHLTVYEEVGHGGSASIPQGVTEILAVDMGCVGEGLNCKEHQVSICAKDSGGPYSYDLVSQLITVAKRDGLDFAVDVYPYYGSDAEAGLKAGYDVRHGLIGSGVYASHGYERSHVEGVKNTFLLLKGYLG